MILTSVIEIIYSTAGGEYSYTYIQSRDWLMQIIGGVIRVTTTDMSKSGKSRKDCYLGSLYALKKEGCTSMNIFKVTDSSATT